MAFVCPAKEEVMQRADLLKNLKCLIDKIGEDECQVPCEPCFPCTCPPECCEVCDLCGGNNCNLSSPPPPAPPCQPCVPCYAPDMMVCYKLPKTSQNKLSKNDARSKGNGNSHSLSRVKQSKSRELRASILYAGCDCEKRNGLQDDCPRTECHGSPDCLTTPNPICGPSEFSSGKHLGKNPYIKYKPRSGNSNGNSSETGPGNGNKNANAADAETIKEEYQCFPAYVSMPNACPINNACPSEQPCPLSACNPCGGV